MSAAAAAADSSVTTAGAAAPPLRDQLADSLFASLAAIKRRLQTGVPADLQQGFGALTWHQVEALHQLATAGDEARGATMNELARMQQCALSSATALVDRLIRQGLAVRRSDPEDRRVIRIVPTARGEEMLSESTEARRRLILEALQPLSDGELASLVRLLCKVTGDACGGAALEETAHD